MSFALHLLRHGAPERAGRLLGRTDDAPTAAGIALCRARVADLLGEKSPVGFERRFERSREPASRTVLDGRISTGSMLLEPNGSGRHATPPIETLLSSDLARAALAAEAIGQDIGLVPAIDPRWRELDFGDWDGLPPTSIDPAALARFHDDPDACPPPDGERWSALVARVQAAIAALPPRPTLIVTHGGAMRAALAILCRLDAHQVWAIDLPYAALLSLRVWPGTPPTAQITGLR